MRVLTVTPEIKERAAIVRQHALAHPESMIEIMRRMNKPDTGPGNDPHHTFLIPDGFKVVYSVEQHPPGTFHHVSVSVDIRNPKTPLPHPVCVNEILAMLELPPTEKASHSWREDFEGGCAINLMFPFVEPKTAA